MRLSIASVFAAGLAASSCLSATALGEPGDRPSEAVPFAVGTPITGTTSQPDGHEWGRLPQVLRPGDIVQVALDATQTDVILFLCLLAPVDDFGADAARCAQTSAVAQANPGRRARLSLTYTGRAGQGFLRVGQGCCGAGVLYTLTIEAIRQRIALALSGSGQLPRAFSLTATARYGDNTPVRNGLRATLQLREGRGAFRPLVAATSLGGRFTFSGRLPSRLGSGARVTLRACVAVSPQTQRTCGAPRSAVVGR